MPFAFGAVTLTGLPMCTARLRVATENGPSTGYAADFLAPKWFEKDPDKSLEQDSDNLLVSARAAAAALTGRRGSVFDLWWSLYQERVPDARASDGLVRGFGVALCERALMDAACRAAGMSFATALRENLFGLRPAAVHSELDGWVLRPDPIESIAVRHTVGFVDPLVAADVDQRIDDGLPETLEEDIDEYGLRYFKLKIGLGPDRDFERLLQIGAVLEARASDYRFTLDGNEQYDELATLRDLLDRLAADALGAKLLQKMLFLEQPQPRQRTFDVDPRDLAAIREITPVLIDEADCGVDAFKVAVGLGYQGVSIKNCKGVFRALLNRGLCEVLDGELFQSGEDLTNLPVLALQQDLTTMATLGVAHVERNGQHYFRGLDHLPEAVASAALAAHPDLYRATADGVALRIDDGNVSVASLAGTGYGYDASIDLDHFFD